MTAAEYRRLILRARKTQLSRTAEHVARLEGVYGAAAASLRAKLETLGEQPLAEAAASALLADVDGELSRLRSDTFALLDAGMTDLAQCACERERLTEALAGATVDARLTASYVLSRTLTDGSSVSVRFGRLARSAVEATADRAYDDGFHLSDRLYSLDADARRLIQDAIVQGVAEGISAAQMGKRLEDVLAKAGAANPRYRAATIAQTEINNAHREAHYRSALDETGQVKSFIAGIGWRLSPSHPRVCRCDLLASDDADGLGAGNYLVDNAPGAPHPRCLCFTVTLLTDYPALQFPGKEPKPDEVPERLRNA